MLDRREKAEFVADNAGFSKELIKTEYFTLTSFYKLTDPKEPLTVYIEGDGLAWINKYQLSPDPTPTEPMVLKMATLDHAPNVIYIARPCQYTELTTDSLCSSDYWSDLRFDEKVITSVNQAVNFFREKGQKINLIGYSGGGAVATLVAARNKDVISLRTLAGNLDHVALNRYHKVSQLEGSLNAINVIEQVKTIPQIHYVGTKDEIVPPFIAHKFLNKATNPACINVIELKSVTHHKGWKEVWPGLVTKQPSCTGTSS
jgi:hypothetical protein